MAAAAPSLHAPLMLGERDLPRDEATPWPEDAPAPRINPYPCLTSLADAIECGRRHALEEAELAPELRTRLALKTLRRRAEKRGRAPILRCTSRDLHTLAKSAGWQTELIAARIPPADAGVHASQPHGAPASGALARSGEAGLSQLWGAGRLRERALAAAQRAHGGASVRGTTRPGGGITRLPALKPNRWLLAALPLSLMVATVLFPHASITLTPVTETAEIEVPLTIDPSLKKPDPATGRLPGRSITKELSDSLTVPATGRRTVPDAKATGEVVLLNRSEAAVPVPKGTIVLAGSVKFATQSDVTVAPSRRAGSAPIFGMVSVRVQAVTGGPAGNVERNKIEKIEGPLSASLTVQNNQPTRGGTERAATFVTEDDRKKLHDQLYRSLADRLSQQIKKDLPVSEKESLVPWSGQNPAVVESSYSRNAEEEAPNLTLTMKVRYGATAFANDAYNQLVREVAGKGALAVKPGYRVARETIQPEPPTLGAAESGVVRLVGRVRATVIADVDAAKLRADLAGKPIAAARAYLAQLPGIEAHQLSAVNFLPGKMPLIGWRIGVTAQPAAS